MITLGRTSGLRIIYLELFRNNFLAGKSVFGTPTPRPGGAGD